MKMIEVFESDGILIGWFGTTKNGTGHNVQVFIPRRDEDIESDRVKISALLRRARQ
jgi:hypothetical protein